MGVELSSPRQNESRNSNPGPTGPVERVPNLRQMWDELEPGSLPAPVEASGEASEPKEKLLPRAFKAVGRAILHAAELSRPDHRDLK